MSVIDDLKRDEGCRLHAYPDPLTGKEPWTVGYGCTGPDIGPDTVWTQEKADSELAERVQELTQQLTHAFSWLPGLAEPRRAVLINMAYQLGLHGLLGFQHVLNAVEHQAWNIAASEMLASHWASQTPTRAKRLAAQMLTGTRP